MIFVAGGAYQGKTEYVKANYPNMDILDSYQLVIKKQLEQEKDPIEEINKMLEQRDLENLVVVSNDVGNGLVPVDKFERNYREAVGRVNCVLAAKADEVYRVICGVATKIK